MLADNKLVLNAGWDADLLRLELEALAAQDYGLQLTGFDDQELKDLLADVAQASLLDGDEAPEPAAVSRSGDLWIVGNHRVLCGECLRRLQT